MAHQFVASNKNKGFKVKKLLGALLLTISALLSAPAHAGWVNVPDASELVIYAHITNQKVYIKGLSDYSENWTQTGWSAYHIDLSTPAGQAAYSLLLTQMAQKGKIRFWKSDSTTTGYLSIAATY